MIKHIAKKRFGQNFLTDKYILNQIGHIINPRVNDTIVEIGPGLGALTSVLLEYVPKLIAIELDRDLVKHLAIKFPQEQLTIYSGDALKFDYEKITQATNSKIRIVGNLPYNISTPLLFYLSTFKRISSMHFLLQSEVVKRICAKPNTKAYGRLSVMLQYKYYCRELLQVPPTAFNPIPKVDSAIIELIPRDSKEYIYVNEANLAKVVTQAFSKRRKTIANSLANLIPQQSISNLDIDVSKRAENLTIDEFIRLSTQLSIL